MVKVIRPGEYLAWLYSLLCEVFACVNSYKSVFARAKGITASGGFDRRMPKNYVVFVICLNGNLVKCIVKITKFYATYSKVHIIYS